MAGTIKVHLPDYLLSAVLLPAGAGLALSTALLSAGTAGTLLPLVILTAAVGVTTLIGAVRGVAGAIAICIVVVSFGLGMNFRVRDPGEVGLDWQNGAKLATWVALAFVVVLRHRDLTPLLRNPCYLLAWLYAGLAAASTGWSQLPAFTAANALGMMAYLGLAGLVAVRMNEVTALRVMIVASTALVAAGLVGGLLNLDVAWMPPSDVETEYRLQGFSGHPNTFGQMAAILCLLVVAAYRGGAIGKCVSLLALAIGLAALLACRSRFALTGFLVSWAFVALRGRPIGRVLVMATLILAAGAAIYAAVLPRQELNILLSSLSRTGDASEMFTLTGRVDLWGAATQPISRAPLFGYGFVGTEGMLSEFLPRNFVGATINPHNMFIQSLMSLGFVGTAPAFALFGLLLVLVFARPDPLRDQMTIFVLINGFGEAEVFSTPVFLNFVLYWAIARDATKTSLAAPAMTSTGDPVRVACL